MAKTFSLCLLVALVLAQTSSYPWGPWGRWGPLKVQNPNNVTNWGGQVDMTQNRMDRRVYIDPWGRWVNTPPQKNQNNNNISASEGGTINFHNRRGDLAASGMPPFAMLPMVFMLLVPAMPAMPAMPAPMPALESEPEVPSDTGSGLEGRRNFYVSNSNAKIGTISQRKGASN